MKKNVRRGLAIVGASLLMVLINSNVAVARFSNSCTRYRVDHQGNMTASCQNNAGQVVETSIALRQTVGCGQSGRLFWNLNGNYHRHCTECDVVYDPPRDSVLLKCKCRPPNNPDAQRVNTTLNLEEPGFNIVNDDGQLRYAAP